MSSANGRQAEVLFTSTRWKMAEMAVMEKKARCGSLCGYLDMCVNYVVVFTANEHFFLASFYATLINVTVVTVVTIGKSTKTAISVTIVTSVSIAISVTVALSAEKKHTKFVVVASNLIQFFLYFVGGWDLPSFYVYDVIRVVMTSVR
jgi:hypothetical protein